MALLVRRAARHAARAWHLRRDVRYLHLEPSGGLHRQCGADGIQQGRSARLRRDGADAGGHHRRHRPLGRHDLHPDQLPRLDACRRHADGNGTRRRGCASRRRSLRCAERRDRHLRTPAADRGDDRYRRRLFRHRAAASPVPGRLGQRRSRRRAHRAALRRDTVEPRGAPGRGPHHLGAVPALGIWPRRLCRGLLGSRSLHVGRRRSSAASSSPIRLPACSLRSAACSSPSSPIRARRPMRAATPTRCSRSRRWCSAAFRCSAGVAARSARSSAPLPSAPSAICLFVFDFDPLWQPLFQGVVLLLAVSLGAFALFRVKNRLEWFG